MCLFHLNAKAKRVIYICLNKFETSLVHSRCHVSATLFTVLYHFLTCDVHVVWTLSSVRLFSFFLIFIYQHHNF